MSARPELFIHSDFPRPYSVVLADASRLAPAIGDAALVDDLRATLTRRDEQIAAMQDDARLTARIIADLQAETAYSVVATFSDPATSLLVVMELLSGLHNAGHATRSQLAVDSFGVRSLLVSIAEN